MEALFMCSQTDETGYFVSYCVLLSVFYGPEFLHLLHGNSSASYGEVIILAVQGYPYPHMWYMFMALGLYLTTPLIWKLKSEALAISRQRYTALVIVLLLLGSIIQVTRKMSPGPRLPCGLE